MNTSSGAATYTTPWPPTAPASSAASGITARSHPRRCSRSRPAAAWCSGSRATGTMDFPAPGYLFQFEALMPPETGYLTSYLANGGKLWMDSQDLTTDSCRRRDSHWEFQCGARVESLHALAVLADFPSKVSRRDPGNARYPVHERDRRPTRHHERRHEHRVHLGPPADQRCQRQPAATGETASMWASELDPLDITELAATVFKWNTNSGTGVTTGSESSATQNILFTGARRRSCWAVRRSSSPGRSIPLTTSATSPTTPPAGPTS